MKIADLEKALRDISADARWNDLQAGTGVPIPGVPERWRPLLEPLVREVLAVDGVRTMEGAALRFDFTASEGEDPRKYRVRVHIDMEPVED